jgi:pyruvate dehydrogenase E2 component (dihydrolipoamide acetyltransferase)
MAIEFKLPEVSEGVTSVDIAEVKVAEGDVIAAGAVICEVETDKAVAEISCPHAGRITKVLVKTGQSVPIGHVLVLIEADSPAANNTASEPPAPKKAAVESVAPAAPATKPVTAASQPASAAPGGGETTIAFRLPEVSEGVKTVDVAVVNVKVGDVIAAGAAVCEVETDKAVAEINCPHAGTITAVHVKPGTTIPIGEVLVDIRTTSGGGVAAPAASAPAPSAAIAATTTTAEAASPASPAVSPVATTGAGASVGKTADNRPPAPAGPAQVAGSRLKILKHMCGNV